MPRKTTKKVAPVQPKATSKTNDSNHTGCRCAKQGVFPTNSGFPAAPMPGDSPLVIWLESHPGWFGRLYLCQMLGIDERTARLQAEHSAGRVIFSSGGGLCATRHASEIEARNCCAELKARGLAHFRRSIEIDKAQNGGKR